MTREPLYCCRCKKEIGVEGAPLAACSACNWSSTCLDCLAWHRGQFGGCAEKDGAERAVKEVRDAFIEYERAKECLLRGLGLVRL